MSEVKSGIEDYLVHSEDNLLLIKGYWYTYGDNLNPTEDNPALSGNYIFSSYTIACFSLDSEKNPMQTGDGKTLIEDKNFSTRFS